jgi:XTP/dITP diphosphohydrolase
MKQLLIATTNPSKFNEARLILETDGFQILSLKDFSHVKPIPETGKTFEENAILKAKGYFSQTSIPVLADDGGLIVDYLGGSPGVNSHRWLGYEATEQELANAIIEKMRGVPREERTARLGGCIIFWDGEHMLKAENWITGRIAENLKGEVRPGFPYRPVLVIPQFDKTYAELTDEEHEMVNFRRKNLRELKPKILEYLKET